MWDNGAGTRPANGQIVGNIRVLPAVASPELGNVRDVQVYLPPSYQWSGRHYPVIYMQDGQNLFDPTTSFSGEWRVDDTLERLGPEGVEAIVVAVPNMGKQRIDEYSPFRDPLKPEVDRRFRTRHERTHTGIMGSSMGGLASLYAFLREPGIFGFAGAMSPSIWFAHGAIFGYVASRQGWTGRIYLDIGTREGRPSVRNARLLARLLRRTASRPRLGVMYVEGRGAAHNESAWADRFERAVRFLLPRRPDDLHW